MIQILLFAIIVSLFTTGLYIAIQWPGMVLHPFKALLDKLHYDFIRKPIYDCLICMSSVWSIVLSVLLGVPFGWQLLIVIPVVAGINTIISILLENLTDYGG